MSAPNHMLEEDMPYSPMPLPSFHSFYEPLEETHIFKERGSLCEETTRLQTLKPLNSILDDSVIPRTESGHWRCLEPGEWSPSEVIEFIYDVAKRCNLTDVSGEKFHGISGVQLVNMRCEEFEARDSRYGCVLYQQLQNLSPPSGIYAEDLFLSTTVDAELKRFLVENDPLLPSLYEEAFFPNFSRECEQSQQTIPQTVLDQPSDYSQQAMDLTKKPKKYRRLKSSDCSGESSCSSTKENQPKKQRGRRPGQTSKAGNHLWEFIRDLLHDHKHNPRIIKWEDSDQGIFRIVKSSEVSGLWGKKKNNSKMTYEKLSRALRFCRTEKYFADLPKDGTFPKKLVFKFGEKANPWRLQK